MTDTAPNPISGDPFCEVARTIGQSQRRLTSGIITGTFASVPIIVIGVTASVAVGAPTGPAAPVVGYAAGVAASAATTAAVYFVHDGIHNAIESYQNRSPAQAPLDLTCRQYFSHEAMLALRGPTRGDDWNYEGSSLQKILRANPRILDEILATPPHSDPMNVGASEEEKRLRGFAVDHAPRPMTRSERAWGEYAMPSPKH